MKIVWFAISALLLVACSPAPPETPGPLEVVNLPTITPTQISTITPLAPSSTVSPTREAVPLIAAPATVTTALPTISATEDACQAPDDWEAYTVQAGETLFAYQLGADNLVTVDEIIAVNCLEERFIYEGQTLWLPVGAAENAPPSYSAPTPLAAAGGARIPNCPCAITIRTGWRLEQIAEVIDSIPVAFSGADLLAVAEEGYMFPGEYTLTNEMDALAFKEMARTRFDDQTATLWGDAAARGMTPQQVVILASIIIRESRSPEQQSLISSVFHNRLNAGKGLGATVTTQYALGTPGNWWPNVHGRVSTFDNPYNTNIYAGYPPTPIANPNLDALRAAVYPEDTDYQYFTANCNGSGNAFAESYDQHLANVRCE